MRIELMAAAGAVALSLGLTGLAPTAFAAEPAPGGNDLFTPVQAQAMDGTWADDDLADPDRVLATCLDGPERKANFGRVQSQALIDNGWGAVMAEDGEAALADFLASLNVGPERPDGYWGLGNAAYLAGLDDAVIDACFGRAIEMLPDVAGLRGDYGNVLSALERWDDAIAAYEAALALDEKFIHAHDGLSAALIAIGDMAGAQAQHDRAEELRDAY